VGGVWHRSGGSGGLALKDCSGWRPRPGQACAGWPARAAGPTLTLVAPAGFSTTLRGAPHSGIREISGLADATPGAIRLEVGQPDFRTPGHVTEAAKRAIDEGWHGYTPTAGLASLRERLAAKLGRVNGIAAGPDEVVCGAGGVSVIAAALAALCNPGDEVLV